MTEYENQSSGREIPDEVQRIEEEIKSLEKNLGEIQNVCPHPKYSVKGVGFPLSPKRICDLCHLDLGYPSQEEMDKWIES
jgi:hypothetical protein